MRPGGARRGAPPRVVALALLAAGLLAPLAAGALEPVRVQLKWRHHFQFAGYYVALAQGFYRDAGLDVTLVEGGPEVEVEAEVAEGRADFGVGTSAILLDRARGRDLVVLAQVFQHSAAVILAPRRAGLASVKDLAGRRVMYSNQHGDILAMLRKNGLDERSFTAVAHAGDPHDLLAGRADAMVAYSINEPFVLERAGEPYQTFSPLASGIDFYGDNLFSTRATAEGRPALVAAFREATLRGWRHALDHKAEAADLILARYSRARSREWLLFEASQAEALIQPDLVELGYQSATRWRRIGDAFAELGMLPQGLDAAAVMWTPRPATDWRPVIGIALAAAVAIGGLSAVVLGFRRVNRRLAAEVEERRVAVRALAEREAWLRATMDAMPVALAVVRGDVIEYANEAFVRTFGWTVAEVPDGRTWFERAYPDPAYRADRLAAWRAATSGGTAPGPAREARVTCRDGGERHVLISSQVQGERTLVIFTDITERERQAAEQLKLQKLESVGLLAGGIAHDFNNLLTAILGNVSLARAELPPGELAAQALASAEGATQRAAELARQLLTFARGSEPVKRAVRVRGLVESAASLALRGTSAALRVEVPEGLCDVEADEGQLGQALTNVLLNAAQAMPRGGRVVVVAEEVLLPTAVGSPPPAGLTPGRWVRLRVADDGVGIREEDLPRVFDPYFTTRPHGSGLGLTAVHSIVRKHGGAVAIRSRPGDGTTVELWLPASAGPEAAPAPAAGAARPAAAGQPILVMDDEPAIRQVACRILERLGHPVEACANGEEALEAYRAARDAGRPFAAAILDLTIRGGMGGAEAAARLLALDPAARLVVSSGYSSDPVLAEHAAHGFRATLDKPYQVTQVAAVLARVLG